MASIYGDKLASMDETMQAVSDIIMHVRVQIKERTKADPVEHLEGRIKTEESMREKCRRKGLPETQESALQQIHDAIGFRIVCRFVSDVYTVRDGILSSGQVTLLEEKDYIASPKPNGYRSLHLVVRKGDLPVEIQIRTISMDTWAALEHQMKYKKNIGAHLELLTSELKRCADELASTDLTLQTLREMIEEDNA